jgi:hypothetical protein
MSDPRPACRAGAKPVTHTGSRADQEREKQQPRIDGGLEGVRRRVARQECNEPPHGERGQHHPERSTRQREKDAVGKKLASDAPARSSQGEARADLPVTCRSARQEETRDIQAGQSQQHRRGGQQNPERLREPAPQNGMTLGSRGEFECRGEKPLPAFAVILGNPSRRVSSSSIALNQGCSPARA